MMKLHTLTSQPLLSEQCTAKTIGALIIFSELGSLPALAPAVSTWFPSRLYWKASHGSSAQTSLVDAQTKLKWVSWLWKCIMLTLIYQCASWNTASRELFYYKINKEIYFWKQLKSVFLEPFVPTYFWLDKLHHI